MTNQKQVVIIGAGPAGLAAAWKLAGKLDTKVILIDQGRSAFQRKCPSPNKCVKCPICSKSSGIGGAGTFSDGKFVFETLIGKRAVGSNLFEDIGTEKEHTYMKHAKNFFSSYGLKIDSPDQGKLNRAREIEIIAAKNDMDYIFACQSHVGTDMLPKFIDGIEKNLKSKGVEITETREYRIRDIERSLDNDKITPEQAMDKLKMEFRYELSSDDYSKIKKSVERKT